MPDPLIFLTASCLISLAWLSIRRAREIRLLIKPILTICPLTVLTTMRTTRDRLAKSNRSQIAQWPIMGPWCTLWHRFNSHLGAHLRAGGLAMGRDSMCRDGCAPPSGGSRQNIDHHPAQRA